jgi:hypothetical protein
MTTQLVYDSGTGSLGYVMGHEGPYVQLRPPGGGREWDADPACVRPAAEAERRTALHALDAGSRRIA